MRIIFIFILLILITIFFLCEIDRNFLLDYKFKSYYYDNFPISILNGIHNSIYRFYENRILYDPINFDFHKYIIHKKNDLLIEFNNNKDKVNIELAHETSSLLNKDMNYKYIRFKHYNKNFDENIKHFSIIKNLLLNYPNIQTCFFSIMESKIKIDYHKGPYNGVLRYHLPLIVDNIDNCYLEIVNKKVKYNSPFIFDDTFPHQLIKKDDTYKVVLIMDVDNPYSLFFKHHDYLK